MENNQFQALLRKYQQNECTPDEKIIVESWYNQWKGDENQLIATDQIEAATEKVWQRIQADVNSIPVRKIIPRRVLVVAASLFVILSVGLLLYLYQYNDQRSASQDGRAGLPPGGNVATLTLADGSKISLASKKGKLASQGNIDIVQSKSGILNYSAGNGTSSSSSQINIIETPKGGEYEIQLSDGTRVFMNAMSSLRFPAEFSRKERRIAFTGEVYLQVAHDASRPFIVEGGNQSIKVLGTEFNINAYQGQGQTKTALVNGKIEVANSKAVSHVLPGEQSLVTSNNSDIKIEKADLEAETAWHNGYFRFRNEDIHSVLAKLSRWYDVEIVYAPGVSNEKFSGVISRYKNINEVLDMLGYSKSVHFKLEGRRLTILK